MRASERECAYSQAPKTGGWQLHAFLPNLGSYILSLLPYSIGHTEQPWYKKDRGH